MQTIYDAKILIVDDNQDLLNLVTTALRSTGYNQLTACTGCAAAQAAFAANRPDLMILDINLPDGDGFTLFRTLHSMADIPALFLSARDADADRLFGLGLGAVPSGRRTKASARYTVRWPSWSVFAAVRCSSPR